MPQHSGNSQSGSVHCRICEQSCFPKVQWVCSGQSASLHLKQWRMYKRCFCLLLMLSGLMLNISTSRGPPPGSGSRRRGVAVPAIYPISPAKRNKGTNLSLREGGRPESANTAAPLSYVRGRARVA